MLYRFNVFTGNFDQVRDSFPGSFSFAYSSQTVNAGYVLDEDGGYTLNEDGSRILLESGISYVLNEDGSYALNEDGTRILTEDSTDPSTVGVATQLSLVSTPSPFIWVTANSTNQEIIRIGGSDITLTTGVPLPVGSVNVHFTIDDVSDLWIIGYYGDGVTFTYAYSTSATTDGLQFGGSDLEFGGSGLTFNP